MKKTKLENQQQVWKGCKNNRSDRKHGTFRKYGLPPIDTPEETSAIPFKKMKPKNEAYNIPRIGRSGSSIKQKPTTEEQTYGFCGENITIQAHSHYNCFRKKKIILPEKQKGIHSEKSKRLKRTANLVAKYPTTYFVQKSKSKPSVLSIVTET